MRRTEILIIRYRRTSVVQNSIRLTDDAGEKDYVDAETEIPSELTRQLQPFVKSHRIRELLVALIRKLFRPSNLFNKN